MIVRRFWFVSKKTPSLVGCCPARRAACWGATRAACRASACKASCWTERRTRTTARINVTPTEARTAIAIAANSRARSDLSKAHGVRAAAGSRLHRFVAGAADRPDQARPPQLAPQLGDVHVHRSRPAAVVESPDPLEQELAGDDDAAVLGQVGEQIELFRPQLNRLVRDSDLAVPATHRHVAKHEP